jgi:hypothetical protein
MAPSGCLSISRQQAPWVRDIHQASSSHETKQKWGTNRGGLNEPQVLGSLMVVMGNWELGFGVALGFGLPAHEPECARPRALREELAVACGGANDGGRGHVAAPGDGRTPLRFRSTTHEPWWRVESLPSEGEREIRLFCSTYRSPTADATRPGARPGLA